MDDSKKAMGEALVQCGDSPGIINLPEYASDGTLAKTFPASRSSTR